MFGLKSCPANSGQVAQITQSRCGGLVLFTPITAGTANIVDNNVLPKIAPTATVIIRSAYWGARQSKRIGHLLGDGP
jgi:hypothetical protein